ncbi:MAG: prepilin peptidase [Anaerolineae bacterium]|nr:prepilin peptidase [Anaerolineae bacterium]
METTKNEWAESPLNTNAIDARVSYLTILKKAVVVFLRLLTAFTVFLVAWSLFDPRFAPLTFLDPRALVLASILLAAGAIDLAKGVVPIEITYPLMLAGIVRAMVVGDPSFLLYWFALAIIYLFNVVGGGDMKLLMGMFGLWPHLEFFIVMEIVIIATHLPIVLYRRLQIENLRAQCRMFFAWVRVKLIDLTIGEATPNDFLRQAIAHCPTSEALSQRGDRLAIAFSLAGIIYLVLMTSAGLNWRLRV